VGAPNEFRKSAVGFGGEVAGLGLSDVIQLNTQNRFSGCISVEYEGSRGLIFLRDGEIVHAEQGDTTGEEAFCDILAWPGGRFSLQPNLSTTCCTIHKRWEHLILDAHRIIDERRAGRRERPPPIPRGGHVNTPTGGSMVEILRQIPGVLHALVQAKDAAPATDASYEAELLVGDAIYLAMVGQRFGSIFQAGEVVSATVEGTAHHIIVFSERSHVVSVLVAGETQVGPVEAEIRRILAATR